MTAKDLAAGLAAARGHGHPSSIGRFRRIVVRMSSADVTRLDTVRANFPKVSRAALVRVFTLAGLAEVEAEVEPPAVPEAGG